MQVTQVNDVGRNLTGMALHCTNQETCLALYSHYLVQALQCKVAGYTLLHCSLIQALQYKVAGYTLLHCSLIQALQYTVTGYTLLHCSLIQALQYKMTGYTLLHCSLIQALQYKVAGLSQFFMGPNLSSSFNDTVRQVFLHARLFQIRRTERAENHKDLQYCQVCRSGCPTKFFVCVFCFAPEIGNATGMPERLWSTRNQILLQMTFTS